MKIRTYDLEKAKEDYQKKVNRFKKEENKV